MLYFNLDRPRRRPFLFSIQEYSSWLMDRPKPKVCKAESPRLYLLQTNFNKVYGHLSSIYSLFCRLFAKPNRVSHSEMPRKKFRIPIKCQRVKDELRHKIFQSYLKWVCFKKSSWGLNLTSCSIWVRIFRARMFLGLTDPHPDPLVTKTDPAPNSAPDPSIIKQK